MKITTRSLGETTIVRAEGRLTMEAEGDKRLGGTIKELVDAGKTRIILDLEHVNVIDAGGLGAMVAAFKRVRDAGGDVVFLRPSAKIRDVFAATRLVELFKVYDDEGEALGGF